MLLYRRRQIVSSRALGLRLRIKHALAVARSFVIGPHVEAVLTHGYNGLLLVAPEDLSIGRQLAFAGEYNRELLEAIGTIVSPASRILIVGAHIGALLIPLAKMAREVVGVEANPRTFVLLTNNVLLNGLSNVRLLSIAASDRDGDVEFWLSRTNSGGSKIRPASSARAEFSYDHPKSTSVKTRRLDDTLRGERAFDLVLLDIEGSEYCALRGMQETLRDVNNLVLEILPNHIENLARVSAEQFMSAIPATFEYVRILGNDGNPLIRRSEFLHRIGAMWKQIYFDGCDVLFSKHAAITPPPRQ